jgi:hypothetical protein
MRCTAQGEPRTAPRGKSMHRTPNRTGPGVRSGAVRVRTAIWTGPQHPYKPVKPVKPATWVRVGEGLEEGYPYPYPLKPVAKPARVQ